MAIERIVPGTIEWEAFYANHIHRYKFAASKINKSIAVNILDAACGVGYGACYLSNEITTAKVTAIDRSLEALAIAKKKFVGNGVCFMVDDCHTLENAAKNGCYNLIVSFETLEHLPRPDAFLKSCWQNLDVGGRLIVSTPNQLVSSPEGLNWDYHEKEYTATELQQMLHRACFSKIDLFGQQFTIKGKLKMEMRADLNRLWSNPFVRLGKWLQSTLRGVERNGR
jgi:2-polyprenyl-3-methyl-5-hydroxy-6-metoxy-1,4-benzoquinol methylase